ncbi:MAG: M67 family metallopeptidase [Thermomicrobiales bacterium]|nr:M67 family metallopeptidase [Thermomicrobiales bacterium]MCO5224165.1 M67 family metallopeptidase [Thermomicrobiales bacterium]MCO5227121.1 M67 family metallopeptidase [Thermomicrobiales bacterium]
MMSRVDRFILSEALRTEVLVHLLDCAPNEGAGMIGAHSPQETDYGTIARAAVFVPGRNTDFSPTHYTMDPLDVIRAFRLFREQGLELGAIVHSHIASPATPSVTDVREWNYPEAMMMIASFAHQPPELRAWRIVEQDGLSRVQRIVIENG